MESESTSRTVEPVEAMHWLIESEDLCLPKGFAPPSFVAFVRSVLDAKREDSTSECKGRDLVDLLHNKATRAASAAVRSIVKREREKRLSHPEKSALTATKDEVSCDKIEVNMSFRALIPKVLPALPQWICSSSRGQLCKRHLKRCLQFVLRICSSCAFSITLFSQAAQKHKNCRSAHLQNAPLGLQRQCSPLNLTMNPSRIW